MELASAVWPELWPLFFKGAARCTVAGVAQFLCCAAEAKCTLAICVYVLPVHYQ